MTTYRNQLILRSDEEYNFVKNKITDNDGKLNLEKLINIPSYIEGLFISNKEDTLSAIAFFVNDVYVTKRKRLVKKNNFNTHYQNEILSLSENPDALLKIRDSYGMSTEQFLAYGKNAYNALMDKSVLSKEEYIRQQLRFNGEPFNVVFSDNDRAITWDTKDSDCGDLVELGLFFCNNIEGYFRCAAEDCTYAAERFIPKEMEYFPMGGADVRYIKKTNSALCNIYSQLFKDKEVSMNTNDDTIYSPKNTELLESFLSGKDIFNKHPDWFYKG